MDEITRKKLNAAVERAEKIVFFGGAGVSTESGIPDFRSTDGLYNQKYDYPPETILSSDFFYENTAEFYRFYFDKMIYPAARPNGAHKALALLEKMGKLDSVVTQNIDGLHQTAGSKRVFELHGSVQRYHCLSCAKKFTLADIYALRGADGVPRCGCGGVIKPDVVLYGEPLDGKVIEGAVESISSVDLLIVGGTSLNVYPAAGLIGYFGGSGIILINRTPTPYDARADLVIRDDIGKVLEGLECLRKS